METCKGVMYIYLSAVIGSTIPHDTMVYTEKKLAESQIDGAVITYAEIPKSECDYKNGTAIVMGDTVHEYRMPTTTKLIATMDSLCKNANIEIVDGVFMLHMHPDCGYCVTVTQYVTTDMVQIANSMQEINDYNDYTPAIGTLVQLLGKDYIAEHVKESIQKLIAKLQSPESLSK